jgi:hypothetical protein
MVVNDLIQVIFEDMDPVWLKFMWDDGGTTCQEMIKIVIMLSLIKLRRRCYFRTITSDLYYYFDDRCLTNTFGDLSML